MNEPLTRSLQRTTGLRFSQFVAQWPAAAEFCCYRDMKLHSILFGWSDPDQALRVAAGILGKRASDGLARALGPAVRGAKPSRQCIEPGSLNPG